MDSRDEAANGLMWLRGETGDQGLQSLNFQTVGMFPWTQQRLDPTFLGNDHNQQYQAMLAAGLQNLGSGDPLKQQFMQFQQPFQYLQQTGSNNPLLQQRQQPQVIQQTIPQHMSHAQTQILQDNLPRHLLQQQLNNQQEQPQQNILIKNHFRFKVISSSRGRSQIMQNMLGSMCPEGSGNLLNFSRTTGQSMLSEQPPQQPWATKFAHSQFNAFANSTSLPPFTGKDAAVEPENCNLDAQNHTLFGVNIDSSGLLLPTTVPSFGSSSVDADVSSMPLGASGFQGSLFGCVQDPSELLQNAGQVDPPTPSRTFVKVYKSGSVGRSLDITRFSSYHELREELGQMENDVLLLGDDPWEAFVNNVWYIKILSPEDVQKMGKQGIESGFSPNSAQRMNSSGTDDRDLVSGLPSAGSLEY
ncbi:Auxin response factor 8 [Vitis vinifera]|uniref:Auxin response factor 8 n=1 Tax=Vitis vinifera TaxID=29760 RepID=A0A438INI8_VITVI|nr:Auxin response factor 8 [Vitis vinifera]